MIAGYLRRLDATKTNRIQAEPRLAGVVEYVGMMRGPRRDGHGVTAPGAACFMLACLAVGGRRQAVAAERDGVSAARLPRQIFAAKLSSIRVGMTRTEVLRILGPPDDIRTATDPGGIETARTSEILRYGFICPKGNASR